MTKRSILSFLMLVFVIGMASARTAGFNSSALRNFMQKASEGTMTTPAAFAQKTQSATADVKFSTTDKFQETKITGWKQGAVNNGQAKAARKAQAKAADITAKLHYAEFDYGENGKSTPVGIARVKRLSADSIMIYNLWGMTDSVKAYYNQATGEILARPQLIHQLSYGPVWLVAVDFDKKTYDSSANAEIKGQVNADGSFSLYNWGFFITSGQYAGRGLTVNKQSDFRPTNATAKGVIMKSALLDSTATYPAYIAQTGDNEICIMNFLNNGSSVNVMLGADKSVNIAPQFIMNNSMYGDFLCYAANWDKSKSAIKGYISGTATSQSIELGNLGVFASADMTTCAQRNRSLSFTFSDGTISFPATKPLTWTGNGSQASPFVITNAEQFAAFAESVNSGNDYSGKYIVLDADIDLSNLPYKFRPAGMFTDKPFKGNFNGQSHTVANLSITQGDVPNTGLFGFADQGSVLTNVKFTGAAIESRGESTGVLVGHSKGKISTVTATGCSVVSYGQYSGGIVGYLEKGSIDNSSFNGDIDAYGGIGGIAGEAEYAHITNCHSSANMNMAGISNFTYRGVGGIAGNTIGANISKCYFNGLITEKTSYGLVGGITGSAIEDTITQCLNAAPLSSVAPENSGSESYPAGNAGGIAGLIYGTTISDCLNGNMVLATKDSKKMGGIVGYVAGRMSNGKYASKVLNCVTTGQVYSSVIQQNTGLYGTTFDADTLVFDNCYYDVQITGTDKPLTSALPSYAALTATLTSGEALSGLSTDIWTFTKGQYPTLKCFATVKPAVLMAAPLTLRADETSKKVKHTFAISTANDVVWKVIDANSVPADAGTGITIKGDSVVLNNVNATDLMVATNDNFATMKMVSISSVNNNAFRGSGTQDDPYLIEDIDDLIRLNTGITANNQDYKGDYFVQTNDIDFEYSDKFSGIGDGTAAHMFAGEYDGQGHTLHRLSLGKLVINSTGSAVSNGSDLYVSLFQYLAPTAVVKNLNMAADCKFLGWSCVSPFVYQNQGRVENCRNYANVIAQNYAAGIVTRNKGGIVTGCYNAGKIHVGSDNAAGIVAYNDGGTVEYCQNDGIVKAAYLSQTKNVGFNYAAGIVSTNMSTGTVVRGNINTGSIFADYYTAGIIASLSTKGTELTGNINYGTVDYTYQAKGSSSDRRGAVCSRAITSTVSTSTANYYDAQIGWYGAAGTQPAAGIAALPTHQLTSGTPLDSLVADKYDWSAGKYPVLKAFKDEPAAIAARNFVVTFADGESSNEISSNATLASADGLTWAVSGNNGTFAVKAGSLQVTLPETDVVADTLTATLNGCTKVIALQAVPKLFEGAGTAADPYRIGAVADMSRLAKAVNTNGLSFSGKHFIVTADIDFKGTAYEPVGATPYIFNADFNGNGKKFTNVTRIEEQSSFTRLALFGAVGTEGAIHDLNLASGELSSYEETAGFVSHLFGRLYNCENHASISNVRSYYVGGLVNYAHEGSSIEGCKNYGAVSTPTRYAAGIVSRLAPMAAIDSCVNYGNVSSATNNAAGIVNYCGGNIKRCVNQGYISGADMVAGVVNECIGNDSILYCHNDGQVYATGSNTAGVIGKTDATTTDKPTVIIGCYNTADITSEKNAAGVISSLGAGTLAYDSYNTGSITSGSSRSGGFASEIGGKEGVVTIVKNCYNTGDVMTSYTGTSSYTGGFAASTDDEATIELCYNAGNVTAANNFVGGFAASNSATNINCYNLGNVTSEKGYGIGGMGGIGSAHYIGCANFGNITSGKTTAANANANYGNFATVGGIHGYGAVKIENSYNMGTLTAKDHIGGVLGSPFNNVVIANCYNAGAIASTDKTDVGNIIMGNDVEMEITNCYYDTDVNPGIVSNNDKKANGLTTQQMLGASLGDGFTLRTAMYPVPSGLADNDTVTYFAAAYQLANGETPDHVKSKFAVPAFDGLTWKSSDNLCVSGTVVATSAVGAATLTKSYGRWSHTFNLNVDNVSGVDDTNAAAKTVASRTYYNIAGMKIYNPVKGTIVIERTVFTDGTSVTRKTVFVK